MYSPRAARRTRSFLRGGKFRGTNRLGSTGSGTLPSRKSNFVSRAIVSVWMKWRISSGIWLESWDERILSSVEETVRKRKEETGRSRAKVRGGKDKKIIRRKRIDERTAEDEGIE